MEWNLILGGTVVVISTHIFIHEIVLAVRGFINSNSSTVPGALSTAQNALVSVIASAQQLATQTGQLITVAATTTVNTQSQSLNTNTNSLLNNLRALSTALDNNPTQASIQTQQATIQTAVTSLSTATQTLFTTISTTASLASLMSTANVLPGYMSTVSLNWNSAAPLLTTAATTIGTQVNITTSDLTTILNGIFSFNEVQFNTYFRSIAANNNPNSWVSNAVRWVGIGIFLFGIAIMNNLVNFGGQQ